MQNKEAEKNFFDQFGAEHDFDVFDKRGYDRLKHELRKYLFTNGERLKAVDIGCGTGSSTNNFTDLDVELFGIDISPNSIKYAQSKYPSIKFKVGDAENVPFENNSVDVVFMCGLLHHFPDFTTVVSEAHRILKKGGVLFAYDPHLYNPIMWLYRSKKSPLYSPVGVTENEQPLAKAQIVSVLKSSNFSKYRVYAISGVTFKNLESKTASIFLPAYNLLEIVLDFPLVRNTFGSFIITYAKK